MAPTWRANPFSSSMASTAEILPAGSPSERASSSTCRGSPERLPHGVFLRFHLGHAACHSRAGPPAQNGQDIVHTGDRAGALLQQLVRPDAHRAEDRARHDQHVATVLERKVGRDERAAVRRRLDNQRGPSETRDDPIASGIVDRVRRRAGRKLRDERAGDARASRVLAGG